MKRFIKWLYALSGAAVITCNYFSIILLPWWLVWAPVWWPIASLVFILLAAEVSEILDTHDRRKGS